MVELLFDMDGYIDKVDESFIEKARMVCEEALRVEGFNHKSEISLSLVSNDEIKGINKRFRKKDSCTDVLSFPLNGREEIEILGKSTSSQYVVLGDIIISFNQATIQAGEYNHSVERELLYLVCHSVFHLLGYDHMEAQDKKIMREKEELTLKNVGITRDY